MTQIVTDVGEPVLPDHMVYFIYYVLDLLYSRRSSQTEKDSAHPHFFRYTHGT